ncbi:hypothetical protein PC111_g10080 [Phytophthora cactorum]|nr:hypothetical protein PC111_g10080 [Phytophthora cactorum]
MEENLKPNQPGMEIQIPVKLKFETKNAEATLDIAEAEREIEAQWKRYAQKPEKRCAVGPPLKALTLQGFDKPFRDIIDLNAVIRSCPNLQEPTLTRDLVDVQLDFSEYRASNTTIPELRFEWLNIADFTGALWGRNSPLDKEVRKIGVLEGAAYKAVVTGSKAEAWNALKHMGRPKWLSNFTDLATEYGLPQTSADDVVHLAANKLLLGISSLVNTYNETVMFGVASMLCRLGVRPRPTSTLASHAVANFMAILAYVGYEKDDYLSSYASDPTYPFLDEDVAKCLASIVESEWNPQALLDGDLEYRRSLEKGSEGDTSVVLSEVMSDDELKETTSLGFAYPSGYRKEDDLTRVENGGGADN